MIPREAREKLKLKAGDKLVIVVRGDTIIVFPRPRSYAKALHGIARGLYPKDYIERERQSWD